MQGRDLLLSIERRDDGGKGTAKTRAAPGTHDPRRTSPSPEEVVIWGLGGAGFAIRTGAQIIYVDPYLSRPAPDRPFHRAIPIPFSPDDIRDARLVLSTHEHNDHCDPATLRGFGRFTNSTFVGPVSSTNKARASGFPSSRIVTVAAGEEYDVSPGVHVRVFPSRDKFEPDAVMYLIETPRGNMFHSGDTSYFDAFKSVGEAHKTDVALLNFGRQIPGAKAQYYMDAHAVAAAATDLKARVVVPMHWDLWVETWDDPAQVEAALRSAGPPGAAFRLLQMGDVLEL